MESQFATHVLGDVLMAVKAKLALPRFVEHLVATGAFAFEICMPMDDFARHDKRLDILSDCSV